MTNFRAVIQGIVGKTEDEAVAELAKIKHTLRVTKLNGTHLMGTCDYCPNRVGVEIDQGKIISVTGMG